MFTGSVKISPLRRQRRNSIISGTEKTINIPPAHRATAYDKLWRSLLQQNVLNRGEVAFG